MAVPSSSAVFLWFFLSEQVLFKEVAVTCWLFSPSVSLPCSLLHGLLQHLKKKEGACLWEGIAEVRKELTADTGPVTVPLKTYRSPNRQRQAAVFGRAAAAAAARCCLWHTARASAVGSTDTTRTRGWISPQPGPMTTRSCRDSENRELPLRLRTWKTSWRWTALPWRSVCPIRQAWSTGKREAELDRPGYSQELAERLRTGRWEQIFGGRRSDIQGFVEPCVQLSCIGSEVAVSLEDGTSVRLNGFSPGRRKMFIPFSFMNFSAVFPLSSD